MLAVAASLKVNLIILNCGPHSYTTLETLSI